MMRMLDAEKVKLFKRIGIAVGVLVLLFVGYSMMSQSSAKNNPQTIQKTKKKEEKKQGQELTQKYVNDFLIAYFTKKDLGENRNRYLPFMAEGAYRQEVNKEDEPVNKAYQGYVVDFELKDSTIYIDQKNNVALAKVTYSNTLLSKKGDYSKAQRDVYNTTTLRLTYSKSNNRYLIYHIDPILIVDQVNAEEKVQTEDSPSSEEKENTNESSSNP